jgi:methionyl-tRNA formyltransferase
LSFRDSIERNYVQAKKKKSVIFLGAKSIGAKCLEFLIKHQDDLGVELIGVLTNRRGTAVRDLAKGAQVPVMDGLGELVPCDYLLSVQYHEILKREHIEQVKDLAINLHMAPLPEYRGCNQFSFAILNEDVEFGTTLHVLDTGIDTGDILFERRFSIPPNCLVDTLVNLTEIESLRLFEDSMGKIFDGTYSLTPQSDLREGRRCEFHQRSEIASLKEISLEWPQEKILRHVRATSMPGFAPPFTRVGKLKVDFKISEEE